LEKSPNFETTKLAKNKLKKKTTGTRLPTGFLGQQNLDKTWQ